MKENLFYLAFSCASGIGPKRFRLLIDKFGSAENAFRELLQAIEISNKGLRPKIYDLGIGEKTLEKFDNFRKSFDIQKYREKLEKTDVYFIDQNNGKYPATLKQLSDPPIGIFVKGDIKCLQNDKTIGVVGTRKVTGYGREVTEKLVSDLISYGFVIVSGLALGVDSTAHKSAIDNNGETIAVLGCGVDCCYPRENQSLYNEIIAKSGLVISEYPLEVQSSKGTFPARNRIIAALSNGVLVTEAGEDSGSLITAKHAIKLQKPVFSVPGPITSRQSDGTSYLLKNGAVLVQNINDIIHNLGFMSNDLRKDKKIDIKRLNISKEEKQILELLEDESCYIDDLAKKTKISTSKLSQLLSSLEMQGYIVNKGGGEFGIV